MNITTPSGKSPFVEKAFRWLLLGGIAYGGMKLINYITPFILESVGNMVALGLTAAVVGLFVLNFKTISLWYLGFCKKITRWIIAMDPISVMNGYLVKLRKKIKNLQSTLLFVSGKKIELRRLIEEKEKLFKEASRLALAAKQQNEMGSANLNATKAMGYKQSIEIYTPIWREYEDKHNFLIKLKENWDLAADGLAFDIELKTEQLNTLRSMVKGLKSIDDLTSSGSAEANALAESFKAAEIDISQRLAYIDDFEKRAKPLLTDMKVKKQAQENDALAFLEEASKDQKLLLPNYQTFTPTYDSSKVEDISYETVKTKYGF